MAFDLFQELFDTLTLGARQGDKITGSWLWGHPSHDRHAEAHTHNSSCTICRRRDSGSCRRLLRPVLHPCHTIIKIA